MTVRPDETPEPKPLVLEFLLAHGVPNILPEALQ